MTNASIIILKDFGSSFESGVGVDVMAKASYGKLEKHRTSTCSVRTVLS